MLAVFLMFLNHQRRPTNLTLLQKLAELDLVGAAFFVPGIVCLLLALQWGGTVYPWADSRVWGCLLGFGFIIAVSVGLQAYCGDKYVLTPIYELPISYSLQSDYSSAHLYSAHGTFLLPFPLPLDYGHLHTLLLSTVLLPGRTDSDC
jgi:hypothetical protein